MPPGLCPEMMMMMAMMVMVMMIGHDDDNARLTSCSGRLEVMITVWLADSSSVELEQGVVIITSYDRHIMVIYYQAKA